MFLSYFQSTPFGDSGIIAHPAASRKHRTSQIKGTKKVSILNIRNSIEYRVWGRYALFSDPITRMGGEKMSTLILSLIHI